MSLPWVIYLAGAALTLPLTGWFIARDFPGALRDDEQAGESSGMTVLVAVALFVLLTAIWPLTWAYAGAEGVAKPARRRWSP